MIVDLFFSWLLVRSLNGRVGGVYWSLIIFLVTVIFVGSVIGFILFDIYPVSILIILFLFYILFFVFLGKIILKKFESTNSVRWILFAFTCVMIFLSVVFVPLMRVHILEPFVVSGASMNPTYYTGDYLIIKKYNMSYENGSVVIYTPPDNLERFYIGRIARGPNEVTEEGITLGEKEYYILGDNKRESLDSTDFGPVRKELIYGNVWVRLYSAGQE